ncbi:MAG: helicase-related protein [Candidatus Aenigmatarchaeota archaeon]
MDSKYYIVNNRAGIIPEEKSVLEVFQDRINRAIENNRKLSFYIAVGFFFFEGFLKLYPYLKKLYEKNLLGEFKVIMGPETKKSTKEILEALKKDASILNDEDFEFIKKLYDEKKFDFRIYLDRGFHVKLYIFSLDNQVSEVWAGSANLTEGGLYENIELIVPTGVTIEERDTFKKFFDSLWEKSTDDVNNLKVIDIIRKASSEEFIYLQPREFIANLIKILGKEYLIKNITVDLSYLAEFQSISYYLCLEKLEKYGGIILANSFGLGKTDVACAIAKYYTDLDKKVLIIYPPVLENHWRRTLKKVGVNEKNVILLSRGMLQKSEFNVEKYNNIDLIIVDEAHHFRISHPKSNRRKNLEDIIKNNQKAHILLITATPINISLLDFVNLIKLFVDRAIYKDRFESEGIINKINEIVREIKKKEINENVIKNLNELINIFTIRIDWSDVIKYFPEDLKKISGKEKIESPEVRHVEYMYNKEIVKNIFDKIVSFLARLKFEYTKLWEKEYKEDKNLIWWYKWRLYKRLESSVMAFKKSLENLLERNLFLRGFLKKLMEDPNYYEETKLFTEERLENIKNTFLSLSSDKKEKVLKNIEKDIENLEEMLKNVEKIKNLEEKDEKVKKLIEILEKEKRPTIIFSESRDTVIYLGEQLKRYGKFKFKLAYGGSVYIDDELEEEGDVEDKDRIQEGFNKGEFDILITTDIMGEGTNLPGPEGKDPVIINFDLPYNPVKLIQRDGRAIRINNPKKVTIYNFLPDRRIDKELELCKILAKRIETIISTIGIDFAIWMIEEKKVKKLSQAYKDRIINLIREYKELLAKSSPEEIRKQKMISLSKDDMVLREFIKYFNISEETIEKLAKSYKKPIYTILEKTNESKYFIVFRHRNSKYTLGELTFSIKAIDDTLTNEDKEKINSLVAEKVLELDREFLKVGEERNPLISKIRRIVNEDKKLREIFNNIDLSLFRKKDLKDILSALEKYQKTFPLKRDLELEEIKKKINSLISKYNHTIEQKDKKTEIIAIIKYV